MPSEPPDGDVVLLGRLVGVGPVRFRVSITRKDGLSDPEGVATRRALLDLGYAGVGEVHFGRIITLDIATDDPEAATVEVAEMCERLLANPVIEDYTIEAMP